MKRKILLLLIAVASLLSACSSTDENGITVSKRWFAQNDVAHLTFNS